MKHFLLFITLVCFSSPAFATETKLNAEDIRIILADTRWISVGEERATEQVFQSSGATFTIDIETKALSQGFWRIDGDKYCSVWPPSKHWSCYDMFKHSEGVVFVSSSGTRYEMMLPPAN
jgi:hypothetical protein